MSRVWVGPTRIVVTVLVGAALVVGASRVPGTAELGPTGPAAGTPSAGSGTTGAASAVAVTSAGLTCVGPETEGLSGVPSLGGTTTVTAATAPTQALGSVTPSASAGRVTTSTQPAGKEIGAATARGAAASAPLTGAASARVTATGSLAPGLAAVQRWERTEGDERALVVTPCLAPRADLWLVGGGGQSTRRERIVLANPGANTVTADVAVLGAKGALAVAGGQDVTVAPHGRTSLLLDALVGAEATPVVHVTATGGLLTAVLEDSWIDDAVGRGADDSEPAAAPATEQVVPVAGLSGHAVLRVAVPGAAEAVVQTRLLSATGPVALPDSGVVRIAGHHVLDIDLSQVPQGTYAVQVRADQPVVAGVMSENRPAGKPQSDFAWTASTSPLTATAGTPVPSGVNGTLVLTATGAPASATVTTVGADGAVRTRAVSITADSVVGVAVTTQTQVWVTPTGGTVRAGVTFAVPDKVAGATGPLVTAYGLGSSSVTTTQVPVHPVG